MLCPRCQSDNAPGRPSCWNCLSPLDGPLAQKFAQPVPSTTAAGSAKPKKQGQGFWLGFIVLAITLFVASLIVFYAVSASTRKALPDDAMQYAPKTAAPAPAAGATTAGAATAGGTTAGATTAGTTTTGSTDTPAAGRKDPAAKVDKE